MYCSCAHPQAGSTTAPRRCFAVVCSRYGWEGGDPARGHVCGVHKPKILHFHFSRIWANGSMQRLRATSTGMLGTSDNSSRSLPEK